MNILFITWPLGSNEIGIKISTNFISQILKILQPISNDILIISQNLSINDSLLAHKPEIINIGPFNDSTKPLNRILNYIRYQIESCFVISRRSEKIDIVILYGGSSLLLPNIISYFYRKKTCVFAQGPDFNITKASFPNGLGIILSLIIKIIDKLNWKIADKIIVESKGQIKFEGLKAFENKISLNGARFLEFDKFKPFKTLSEREKIIGYIGALGTAKGIMEFVESIPLIDNIDHNAKFLIGGDGYLMDDIKAKVSQLGIKEKVDITGWIPHEVLPEYLNKLKLLILPSYTEGLPTIILEAMACGTPVLATPVGGIPDIIEDGKTGFILDNNSPEYIKEGVVRALNHPGIEEICDNAHTLVLREFSLNRAIERYRDALFDI